MGTKQNILIVGAGFAGATVARELAVNGYNVTVIDQRNHMGGNAYDYVNEHGILIHKYGTHIFHTHNEVVFKWVSQFTDWVEYKHKVKAMLHDGTLVTFPPTYTFVQQHGLNYIKDTFYVPYTKKMWGIDIEDIDDSVIRRVSIREDDTDLYFPNDTYQYMPADGYTKMFERILDHENITVKLNTPFDRAMESEYSHVFNSMPIDVYYDYCYGELPYRSIKFTTVDLPMPKLFDYPVINFTHNGPNTRITEWKNLPNHGVNDSVTSVTYETPCDYKDNDYERYYPVKDSDGDNRAKYKQYANIKNDKVTFIGRCGMYVYIDMHQAISSSLYIAHRYISP